MKTKQLLPKSKFLIITLLLFFFISMSCESKKAAEASPTMEVTEMETAETLTIDAEALYILERGLSFLSNLGQYSVLAQSTFEDVLDENHRVDYETSTSLIVNRPNKIRIERYGLEMHQLFYYNGDQFTLNNPYDKVYATEPLKGSIENMFHHARDNYGLGAPGSDLVYNNAYDLLTQNIQSAKVIGKEMIGNLMCDHLLFVRPNVSFQIWISESKPHLPYKYVVTDTSTSKLLSFSVLMSNWNIAPQLSGSMFEFIPTQDMKKIEFLKIDAKN